jgi:YbgC/YbaW family acyl-CoA thioester hydrolase
MEGRLMPATDRYVAVTDFFVRYAETDAQGIVHHASYIIWMEEARSHYARSVGTDYADFERSGYFMSVISVEVAYRAPAHYGDRVAVSCWVEEVKSRTVSFGYEIKAGKITLDAPLQGPLQGPLKGRSVSRSFVRPCRACHNPLSSVP